MDAWTSAYLPNLFKSELRVERIEGLITTAVRVWREYKRFLGNDKQLVESLADFLFLKEEKDALHRIAAGLLERFGSDSEFRDLRQTFDYIAGTLRLAGEEERARNLHDEWERQVMRHLVEEKGPSRALVLAEKKCANPLELRDNFKLLVAEIRKLEREMNWEVLLRVKKARLKTRNEMMADHPILKDYVASSVESQPAMDAAFKRLVRSWLEQGWAPTEDTLIVEFIFQDLALNDDSVSLLSIGRFMTNYNPSNANLHVANSLLFASLVNNVLDVAGKTGIAEELRGGWRIEKIEKMAKLA